MSLLDGLALALFPCLVVNWGTFAMFALIGRARPSNPATDRFWLSLGIAVANSALALLAVSYFWRLSLGPEFNALLLTLPVFALTAVNVAALWLTWRRGW